MARYPVEFRTETMEMRSLFLKLNAAVFWMASFAYLHLPSNQPTGAFWSFTKRFYETTLWAIHRNMHEGDGAHYKLGLYYLMVLPMLAIGLGLVHTQNGFPATGTTPPQRLPALYVWLIAAFVLLGLPCRPTHNLALIAEEPIPIYLFAFVGSAVYILCMPRRTATSGDRQVSAHRISDLGPGA